MAFGTGAGVVIIVVPLSLLLVLIIVVVGGGGGAGGGGGGPIARTAPLIDDWSPRFYLLAFMLALRLNQSPRVSIHPLVGPPGSTRFVSLLRVQ